jgi:ATP-binding protein involved in chromosome partitioning
LVQSVREAGDAGRPAVFQENTPSAIAFENLVTTFIENVNIVQKRANLKV